MTNASKNKTTVAAEPGRLDLYVTREFDFPRELVFRAFTDPAMFVQWMGPRELKMELEVLDARGEGSWRYISRDADGNGFGFHGVFHEVLAPERIIQTFEFEGLPEAGHVILETARFEELPGGRTRMVGQSVFQSLEDRDEMIAAGMESGIHESYERLDELLGR